MAAKKKPAPQIDVTEWALAIAQAEEIAGEHVRGVSAEELAGAMSCSVKLALRRLRAELKAGRWVLAGRRQGQTTDGRRCYTPVYAPAQAQESAPAPAQEEETSHAD